MMADQLDAVTSRQIASASLRTFMRLNVAQRSSVILMDVLGCSLTEICEIMDVSLAAAKAALVSRARAVAQICREPEDTPQPALSDADRKRLGAYVAHFNARDFDAIRAMIADDVRLDLVSKTRMTGKAEVSRYFGNYSKVSDWHLVPGLVEGHPAILVFDPNAAQLEAEIFHAAELVGRQGRDHPGFPPRALHHRWRRISDLNRRHCARLVSDRLTGFAPSPPQRERVARCPARSSLCELRQS